MILSYYVVDLGLRASLQRRGKRHITSSLLQIVGFVGSDKFRDSRVLHLADIVAPKVKTSTTDEEVRPR